MDTKTEEKSAVQIDSKIEDPEAKRAVPGAAIPTETAPLASPPASILEESTNVPVAVEDVPDPDEDDLDDLDGLCIPPYPVRIHN